MRNDGIPPANKTYREHDDSFGIGYRMTQQGCLVTGQSESTGLLTRTHFGDEQGWVYWEADSRAMGAWSQAPLAVVTTSGGLILPVRNQSLDADTRFAEKQLVTTPAADDPTQVLHLTGDWEEGDYGFVVQGSEDDTWELIFVPASRENVIYIVDGGFDAWVAYLAYTYVYHDVRTDTGASPYYAYHLLEAGVDYEGFNRTPGTTWQIEFYDSWSAGVYSDLYWRCPYPGLEWAAYSTTKTRIRKKLAGTGIAEKLTYYPPDCHPYEPPSSYTPGDKYLRVVETPGILTGTATGGSATTLIDTTKDFREYQIHARTTLDLTSPTRTVVVTSVSTTTNPYDTLNFATGTAVTGSTGYTVTDLAYGYEDGGTATGGDTVSLIDTGADFMVDYGAVVGTRVSMLGPDQTVTVTAITTTTNANDTISFAAASAVVGGTTTYRILGDRRVTYSGNGSTAQPTYKPWTLGPATDGQFYRHYDPGTDTASTASSSPGAGYTGICMDLPQGPPGSTLEGGGRGWNDEAENYYVWSIDLYNSPPVEGTLPLSLAATTWKYATTSFSTLSLPDGADAYCTESGTYVAGHESAGGRVWWPRDRTKWRVWNSGTATFDTPASGDYIYMDPVFYDEWTADGRTLGRLSSNYGAGTWFRVY